MQTHVDRTVEALAMGLLGKIAEGCTADEAVGWLENSCPDKSYVVPDALSSVAFAMGMVRAANAFLHGETETIELMFRALSRVTENKLIIIEEGNSAN